MPRPQRKAPPYDERAIRSQLLGQAGVITRVQLIGLGATPGDLERFRRRGALHTLSPGVYVNHNGPLSPVQRAWWACLHYGRAAVADESALQLARAADGSRLTSPLAIALATHRSPAQLPGIDLRRVNRLDDIVVWNSGLPSMRPEYAALRRAARGDDDSARVGALVDAVNWRTTKVDRMVEALDLFPRLPHRAFIVGVLDDLATGTCSVLEREFLLRVERAHGLPAGQRQQPRRTSGGVEFRDIVHEVFLLVIELDGRAFHSGKKAWDADHERDLDDLVEGRQTARLGWQQVLGSPCDTAGKLGAIFRTRGWTGPVLACSPDCSAA